MRKISARVVEWIVLISLIWSTEAENQCYADIRYPYNYFSTITSYEASRASFIKTPEHCTPKYMWALIRHGTKFNSKQQISEMRDLIRLRDEIVFNHEEGRGELCEKDVENIKTWKYLLTESLDYGLTMQGRLDLESLSKRLKNRFPSILSFGSRDDFIIETSEIQRAKDSAVSFTNALLGTNYENTTGNRLFENQQLLHPTVNCPRYQIEVEKNPTTYAEYSLFLKSEEVQQIIRQVSKRLGFNYTLSEKEVRIMYDSCAYENAWHLNSKPAFCAPFTEENLKVFEYTLDLKYYMRFGYGHPMNEKVGCSLVRNMMMTLSEVSHTDHPKHRATLYFSHMEAVLPTKVKLGLNRDAEPLRHDNYDQMKDRRKWKLAFTDSFASNIIAVLFKCPGHQFDENQVVLYQSEHEVIVPGCPGSPCSLKVLQQNYEDVFDIRRCNTDFCYSTPSSNLKSKGVSISFNWTIVVILYIFKKTLLPA